MKKILMAMVFVLPLFLLNNVKAQNGAQGGDPPYFSVDVYVTAPSNCPTNGTIDGYIPILNHAFTNYGGPNYYGNPYVLVWQGNFTGTQPCTVEVTTDEDSAGHYCHAMKTETVTGCTYGHTFNLELDIIGDAGGGGNEQ